MRKFMVILSVLFCVSCGEAVEDSGNSSDEPVENQQESSCFDSSNLDSTEDENRNVAFNEYLDWNDTSFSPRCEVDGFGVTGDDCDHLEEREGLSEKHQACDSAEYQEQLYEGSREFNTPCMWLVQATIEDDFCTYRTICVTEEQWPEFDWDYTWEEQMAESC